MICFWGGVFLGVICFWGGLFLGWFVFGAVCFWGGLFLGWLILRVVYFWGGLFLGWFRLGWFYFVSVFVVLLSRIQPKALQPETRNSQPSDSFKHVQSGS